MPLNRLPVELLSLVLKSIDSPLDLLSLIIASSPCRAAYASAPSLFLASVLRNAIQPDAMPHALAALRVPVENPVRPEPAVASFLAEYFGRCSFEFPVNMPGLKSLCRLYNRVSFFINDYSSRAIRLLVTESSSETVSPLSATERARLQRAFFRYEIYCQVFPIHDLFADPDPLVRAPAQFSRFLNFLEAWEVEEISCVHCYFMSLVGGCLDRVEDQLVEAALSSPGVSIDEEVTSSEGVDMVGFDSLELDKLRLFSRDITSHGHAAVSYIASMGSSFVYQLIHADDEKLKDMIRDFDSPIRDFIPEAIDSAPRIDRMPPGTTVTHDAQKKENPLCANRGYSLVEHRKGNYYLPIKIALKYYALRERGFVFWDTGRICQRQAMNSLQEAVCMDKEAAHQLYDRAPRKSVEERLEGIRVPRIARDRLMDEFGHPDDEDFKG